MDTILYIKTYFTQKTPFNCTEQQKNTFHKDTTWKVTTSEENRLYGHIFNNIPFFKNVYFKLFVSFFKSFHAKWRK